MAGEALREIIASFGFDIDTKQLKRGESLVEGFAGKLRTFAAAAAGAFAIKEIGEFAFGLAEQAVELEHHAEALGISAQALQKWDFAASLSGVSAEELQIGLQKLQRSAVGAGGSGGELAATFAKLHVTVKNSNGSFKNADELLTDVAGAIGDMTDPTLQTATAMQIFGRGGARLLPFLKQGRAGVAALKDEVEALGGGFTDDFIEKSKDMVQNSKRLDFALLGLKTNAIGPLLPLITELAEGATKGIVEFGKWVKQSDATKTALIALGIGGAAALTPLLLSIAPLVLGFLALEDAVTFLDGGKSLTGDLINKVFGPGSAETVQKFFKSISADFDLASQDAYSFQVKWQTAIGAIRDEKTKTFNDSFWAPWIDAYYATVNAMRGGFGGFVSFVIGLAKGLNLQINAVWDDIYGAFNLVIAGIEDGFNGLWNRIARGGNRAVGQVLSHIPGFEDIGKEILASPAEGEGDASTDNVAKARTENNARAFARLQQAEAIQAQLGLGDPNLDARNRASAPLIGPPVAPTEIKQNYSVNIVQNIKADTPEELKKAASDGAKDGVTAAGVNDRTMRALVPKAG